MADTPETVLTRFTLGQHVVELTEAGDGTLTLWLDGCVRKRRAPGVRGTYLWTNVELPFEDHHLVEVRRGASASAAVDIHVNGTLKTRVEVRAA